MSVKSAIDDKQARDLGEGLFQQMSRQHVDVPDLLWLIRNGASMHVTDKDGMTPLLRAMGWGNALIIGEMIGHGADVNYAGGRHAITAVQIAASGSNPDIMRMMIDAGGDFLKKNASGANALEIARRTNAPTVLPLVEARAQVQQAAADASAAHSRALNEGLPVEKAFRPMKRITLRPH